MVLNLSPPWHDLLPRWSLSGPVAEAATPWKVDVTVDVTLPRPDRPYFEAQPVFQGTTCTLSLPGFVGVIDSKHQQALLRAHPAVTSSDIHYFLRVVMALILFHQGNLLVHAAGVVTEMGALLFVGQSGSGKSTISSLADGQMVLHDDLVYLQPQDQGWLVYAPPGEGNMSTAGHPLTNVLLLAHTSDNYLTPVRPVIALAELVANSPVVNASSTYLPQLFGFWHSLLRTIPVQRLHFRPDHSFWKVLNANVG